MGLELLIRGDLSFKSDLSISLSLLAHWMGASSVPICYRNAANIGSKGLYGALRVLFGIGLEACWLDQAMDLTGGLILG